MKKDTKNATYDPPMHKQRPTVVETPWNGQQKTFLGI